MRHRLSTQNREQLIQWFEDLYIFPHTVNMLIYITTGGYIVYRDKNIPPPYSSYREWILKAPSANGTVMTEVEFKAFILEIEKFGNHYYSKRR